MSEAPILSRQLFFSEFEPLVGQTFVAHCEPKPAELLLEQVVSVRMTGAILRPQFTLIFSSAPSVLLVPATYEMRCGQFGPVAIDIAPVNPPPGAKEGRYYYQAAFS